MSSNELSEFNKALDTINIQIDKILEQDVKFRNSGKNLELVQLRIQKRVLQSKINNIENGSQMVSSVSATPETTLEQTTKEKPLDEPVTCDGKGCDNPTTDPTKLCLICKSKKENHSKLLP